MEFEKKRKERKSKTRRKARNFLSARYPVIDDKTTALAYDTPIQQAAGNAYGEPKYSCEDAKDAKVGFLEVPTLDEAEHVRVLGRENAVDIEP